MLDRRIPVQLTPAEHAAMVRWSRHAFALCAIGIGVVVAPGLLTSGGNASVQASVETAEPCRDWDAMAGEAIALHVRSGSDADLRAVGDSVFRMRRARRNCERGWLTLACQDYQAIGRHVPGRVLTGSASLFCETSMAAMAANK